MKIVNYIKENIEDIRLFLFVIIIIIAFVLGYAGLNNTWRTGLWITGIVLFFTFGFSFLISEPEEKVINVLEAQNLASLKNKKN